MGNNKSSNDRYEVDDQNSESENEMEDIINDEVVRAIESNVDDGYWSIFPCRIRLPGKKDAVVTMDKNITVSQINARLDAAFGFRAYFLGEWHDGEIMPICPENTMRELDEFGTDFAIAVGVEHWDDGWS